MMDPQSYGHTPFDKSFAWLSDCSTWSNGDQRIAVKGPLSYENLHSTPAETTTTLFVGDLSVMCDEGRLFELFYPYGEIESVQLKKSDRDPLRSHLGFGFVKFKTHENAEKALRALNGFFLLGRAMRVGWAEDYGKRQVHSTIEKTVDPKKQRQTAQIHVTFTSRNLTKMVSEMDLGAVFERFGNLVDIAIKRNVVNEALQTQSGYAFIHFTLNNEGIQSAVTAVETVNNCVINDIIYQVKVTHTLQAHILAMKNPRAGSHHSLGEFETYSKVNQRPMPLPPAHQRVNGNLPAQLVHTFPDDLLMPPPPPPSTSSSLGMSLRTHSLEFGERDHRLRRPLDLFANRGNVPSESLPIGPYSLPAQHPEVRPQQVFPQTRQREMLPNLNQSLGTFHPTYPQGSFE